MSFNIGDLINKFTGSSAPSPSKAPSSAEPNEYSFKQADSYRTADEMQSRVDGRVRRVQCSALAST